MAMSPLLPASFRGVPFWVEKDSAPAGRRLAVHEFPHREAPFVEDMGRQARKWQVTAYLVADDYVAQKAALVAAVEAYGPGTLTLPTIGAVQAYCRQGTPERGRERQGYVAFPLEFVEHGEQSALVPLPLTAQLAFDAVAALSTAFLALPAAVAGVLGSAVSRAALVAALQDVSSTLEAIRVTTPVDAAASLALETRIAASFAAIEPGVSAVALAPPLAPRLLDDALALGEALAPADAAAAFTQAFALFDTGAASPARPLIAAGRVIMLAGEAEAILGQSFTSRDEASAARRAFAGRLDATLADWAGASDDTIYAALLDLRQTMFTWFARTASDLKPLVVVDVPSSLPAVLLAWRLYGDPARADEIIARNRAPHPGYIGPRLQALAA